MNLARAIFFNIPNIMRGIVFSSVQYSLFAVQREYVRGDNGGAGFSVGSTQAIMGNILMYTLSLAFPAFGALRVFSLISWGVYLTPMIAGFVAGAYRNIKERLTVGHPDPNTQRMFIEMFETIDRQFAKIPPRLSQFLTTFLSIGHTWFGTIFFAAQLATMGAFAVLQPWVGIPGLVYLAMYVMRANGYMPLFIAKPMEKIDYWVGLTAGLAIGGLTYLVSTVINLIVEFSLNVVLPKFLKWKIDPKTDVMHIENLTSEIKKEEYAPKLPRNMSINTLHSLVRAMPNLAFDMERGETFETQIDREMSQFTHDFADFSLNERPDHYMVTNIKPFLDQLPITKGRGLGVTFRHMGETPFKAPVAEQVNFAEFKASVSRSNLMNSVKTFKAKSLSSPKFWKISSKLESELLTLSDRQLKLSTKITENNRSKTQCEESANFLSQGHMHMTPYLQGRLNLQGRSNEIRATIAGLEQQNATLIRERDAVQAEMAPIHQAMIRAHGDALKLPDTATEEEIILTCIEKCLDEIYKTIEGGSTLWEKKADSVEEFKNKGRHVIIHCRNLLDFGSETYIGADHQATLEAYNAELIQANNDDLAAARKAAIIEAHDILGQMAIEAADFCASGIYDVVNKQYESYVVPRLTKATGTFSPREQVLIQLQKRRQALFDMLYNRFMNQPDMRLWLATADPNDRHLYNMFVNLFESFNITATFNAKSDLSVQRASTKTRLLYNMFAYAGARIMMSLDAAYSPIGIVWNLSKVDGESTFNAYACCAKWAEEFAENVEVKVDQSGEETKIFSGAVYEQMMDILYYGTDLEKRNLLALMLVDFDVLSTNGRLDEDFKRYLPPQESAQEQAPAAAVLNEVAPQQNSSWCMPNFRECSMPGAGWFRSQQVPQGTPAPEASNERIGIRNRYGAS